MHRMILLLLIPAMLLVLLTRSNTLAAEARGTVIAVNGQEATIRLSHIPSDTAPAVGDRVELSYSYGEDVIPVGTWRVSEVGDAAIVVASPVDAAQPPQLNLDAVVHVSGTQRERPDTNQVHTGTQLEDWVEEPPRTTTQQTNSQNDDWRRRQLAKDAATAQMRNKEGPIDLDEYARVYNELLAQMETAAKPAPKAAPEPESKTLDLEANNKLAWDYLKGRNGKPRDEPRAFELFNRGCDGGMIKNCVTVAWMYYNAKGVEQDLRQAALYYRNGCEGGYHKACTDIGNMYRTGKGVSKDLVQAAAYYDIGCRNSVGESCDKLGQMAAGGQGVEKDRRRAVSLFEKGCDLDYALSCGNLGVMYAKAWGVDRDRDKAAVLYKQGCDAGFDDHCGNLGYAYSKGWGVEKSIQKAIPLLERGCAKGHDTFCKRLETIR